MDTGIPLVRILAAVGVAISLLIPVPHADASKRNTGSVYFVSTSGSDQDPGTTNAPWRTIQRSLERLEAGDTLYVRGGTYRERVRTWKLNDGAPGARVVVAAFPNERPVVSGLLWIHQASYWTIDGLDVTWDSSGRSTEHMVKFTGGTNWEYVKAEVSEARSYANLLVAGNARNWALRNLHVHHAHRAPGTNRNDLVVVTGKGPGVIENSLLENSENGTAVKITSPRPGARGPSGVVVRYNTMRNNRGPSNVQISFKANHNTVYRNDMGASQVGRANVTQFRLNGPRNVVHNNIGRHAQRVLAKRKLIDGGGNLLVNDDEVLPDPGPSPSPNDPAPSPSPSPTQPPASGSLTAAAESADRVRLEWSPPSGTKRIRVVRDGRLLDEVPHSGSLVYTDQMLWESTTYTYEVTALADGSVLGQRSVKAKTPARTGKFSRLYAPDSFWNTPIPSNPKVDPNSKGYVQDALVGYAHTANLANSVDWGIPITYANPVSTKYDIGCTTWHCNTKIDFRVPTHAKPTTGSDHHLAVIDAATGQELDMWEARYNKSQDRWTAGSRYLTTSNGPGVLCGPKQGCGGAVAAGFALAGGVIRPEEIAQGRIEHALVFTTPLTHVTKVACPATKTDGKSNSANALPEGARIQLDPSFDVDAQSWPKWKKVMAKALQEYGAYLADTSGSLAIRGEAVHNRGYDAWKIVGVPEYGNLKDLPWNRFRVLDTGSCQ